MSQVSSEKKNWEFETEFDHFVHLIGNDYGENPLDKKEVIERDKAGLANVFKQIFEVEPNQTGVEIGTGCGHIANVMAEFAHHIYAVDISSTYTELAKKTCAQRSNISFHVIQSGVLDFIDRSSVDFIYSNNVFIHLDFYEVIQYLREATRILKPGGTLWFDIADIDRVNFLEDADFLHTLNVKIQDPKNKHCIQHNSSSNIVRAATQMGLSLVDRTEIPRCNTRLFFKRNPNKN